MEGQSRFSVSSGSIFIKLYLEYKVIPEYISSQENLEQKINAKVRNMKITRIM